MSNSFDENYWSSRYLNEETGWDVGEVTFPIKQYLDQLQDHDLKILIPGAGNAYEASYAFDSGFRNVHVLDFAYLPLISFKNKQPHFPSEQIHCEDFFQHPGKYDLIIEQTFFCALDPQLRKTYAVKMHELLKEGGRVVGVLFNRNFEKKGPPFGGLESEYREIFADLFIIEKMETCFNSIPPRAGNELFVSLKKI
jgi:methyl halide transferase